LLVYKSEESFGGSVPLPHMCVEAFRTKDKNLEAIFKEKKIFGETEAALLPDQKTLKREEREI
jgi:hypothetical protein